LVASGLAVDRKMQILIGGDFNGNLPLNGSMYPAPRSGVNNLWFAKLAREGSFVWSQSRTGADDGTSQVGAIVTDPTGNMIAGTSTFGHI
jgi:hypothetical protein